MTKIYEDKEVNNIKNINKELRKISEENKNLEKENFSNDFDGRLDINYSPEDKKIKGFMAMGIIFVIITLILTIIQLITFIFFDQGSLSLLIAMLISGVCAITGFAISSDYKRIDKIYKKILSEVSENKVISISELNNLLGQSINQTKTDIKYMLSHGYFSQGRLVENDKLFIFDRPTYRLYKQIKTDSVLKTPEENVEISNEDLSVDRKNEILEIANENILSIKDIRDQISNKYFTEVVDKFLLATIYILKVVEKYPDKSLRLNKFSDYYLPTSLKLIESYKNFEELGGDDPQIAKSKEDIKDSIILITDAFEKIKLELLSDQSMDIKTDIDTINLLLTQEGYRKKDWSKNE